MQDFDHNYQTYLVLSRRSPDEGAAAEAGPTPEELETARDNWTHGRGRLQPPLEHRDIV